MDYQIDYKKYLVTGDWSQSTEALMGGLLSDAMTKFLDIQLITILILSPDVSKRMVNCADHD